MERTGIAQFRPVEGFGKAVAGHQSDAGQQGFDGTYRAEPGTIGADSAAVKQNRGSPVVRLGYGATQVGSGFHLPAELVGHRDEGLGIEARQSRHHDKFAGHWHLFCT